MPEALLAGGQIFALPQDASVVEAAPLRPAPLAAAGMLGVAVVAGQVVPVMAAAPGLPGGSAWVMLDGPGGRVVVAGQGFVPLPPQGAPLLVPPRLAARRAPPPLPAADAAEGWAVPMRGAATRQMALAAELGALRLVLPFAALERVVPMPVLRPAPAAGACALGYAVAAGAPVLVLDAGWLMQAETEVPQASLLVLFRHGGRRLGLPCTRIGPARAGEATLAHRLDQVAEALTAAPLAEAAAPPAPTPTRAVLLCSAGGQAFALPVEEVVAVIPPQAPTPAPEGLPPEFRGVAAHRGDVLPVLDAGLRLGGLPVLGWQGAVAPLLRLAGTPAVALAVSHVTGLRRIAEHDIAAVAGEGLVSAVVAMGDQPLPVCRAAILGATR
ncbi:chemotaxis protein CheW [Falsiroseomonas sp. E2-1-a4]|uniref:chemotaxis protein CheW n=1 Tax=Falsiroseomonas sp. E2-1-a4 TaxID=3239299 RepID=UPI003F378B21